MYVQKRERSRRAGRELHARRGVAVAQLGPIRARPYAMVERVGMGAERALGGDFIARLVCANSRPAGAAQHGERRGGLPRVARSVCACQAAPGVAEKDAAACELKSELRRGLEL